MTVSQWRHVWTLRNMIVVTPAVLWGAICLAAALAGTAAGRRRIATVAVALGVSLVPTAAAAASPYKPDARGLVTDLLAVRRAQPRATFVFLGSVEPPRWQTGADRARDATAWRDLSRSAVVEASAHPCVLPRVNGPEVVTVYHGMADPFPSDTVAALVARLGSTCRVLPVYGFGVVRCD